jgi:hypothetical protein
MIKEIELFDDYDSIIMNANDGALETIVKNAISTQTLPNVYF